MRACSSYSRLKRYKKYKKKRFAVKYREPHFYGPRDICVTWPIRTDEVSELFLYHLSVYNVVESESARSLDELSEELAQTKEVVDRLWRQAASLSQEISLVSADVKATLRLLLKPSSNDTEQLQTPAARVTRRERAARFRRGFSEASAADQYYSPKSSRRICDESSSPSISANHRTAASTSKPLTRRVDSVRDSDSQQRSDTQLTTAVQNHNVNKNISKCSVKHWQTDVDNLTKSSSSNAAPAAASDAAATTTVRLGRSLLRSSTSPEFIQHHMTSLISADGQRPQTLLTTSTMKRVEKFRRRAAAASTTDSSVTSTDL